MGTKNVLKEYNMFKMKYFFDQQSKLDFTVQRNKQIRMSGMANMTTLEELPMELKERLYQLFKFDFEAFGYTPPLRIEKSSQTHPVDRNLKP